jgi:hypothetical protein
MGQSRALVGGDSRAQGKGLSRVIASGSQWRRREFNDQGLELYDNAAITPWFLLKADIQTIDPAQLDVRSAFPSSLRAKIDF